MALRLRSVQRRAITGSRGAFPTPNSFPRQQLRPSLLFIAGFGMFVRCFYMGLGAFMTTAVEISTANTDTRGSGTTLTRRGGGLTMNGDKPTYTYEVRTPEGMETIHARRVRAISGCLVFGDGTGWIRLFAPGAWLTVVRR